MLSVQPKRNGNNGNWLNVHVIGDDNPSSINWDDVSDWKEIVETEEEVALLTMDEQFSQEVIDAKEK